MSNESELVAEGLWGLSDYHEKKGDIGKAIKCLEAMCQSGISFLPIVQIKTRIRVATLLLKYSNNINHAKAHLERAQLLLKSIPSCFELKCRAYSLLSQCYQLLGATASQKQILNKGLELIAMSEDGFSARLWLCNFSSQLANALISEQDYNGSIFSLERGLCSAAEMCYSELQMFFATSILHVHLMQWNNASVVQEDVNRCNLIWESIDSDKRQQCLGLLFYNELLQVFYLLRICDYKSAAQHVEKLDDAMKSDLQRRQYIKELNKDLTELNRSLCASDINYTDRSILSQKQAQLEEQLNNLTSMGSTCKEYLEPTHFGNVKREWGDKLELAPPPIDGEWLPKGAIYALVDLTVVVFSRPKGYKDIQKRIQSGLLTIQEELEKLGINDGVKEVDLLPSAISMGSVYLDILMLFLENKIAVDLTRSEFFEAQEALVQMRNWFIRFPTILRACESNIEMLRGQYAHSIGCYEEASFHFLEASKLTENNSMQAMCHIFAAISFICIDNTKSSSKVLELLGPIMGTIDSFVGVREKTSLFFAHGFLLLRQKSAQEARDKLAAGLQIAHNSLGNLQLVSQYLSVLGNLALSLHDAGQAREILRSSLTLAKKLYDLPTQVSVLSNLTELYQQLGEQGNESENREYGMKKLEELQKRLSHACSSSHHKELIAKVKTEVPDWSNYDLMKRTSSNPPTRVDLDIPESIGLSTASPMPSSSSRLMDVDLGRIRKRTI